MGVDVDGLEVAFDGEVAVSDGDSTQSVYRRHWAKLSTPEEVNGACSVLEEFGWLRIEVAKTNGRSTTKLRLHPTLREQA